MKFTEGYWEKNERANASYAMQAFTQKNTKNVILNCTKNSHNSSQKPTEIDT